MKPRLALERTALGDRREITRGSWERREKYCGRSCASVLVGGCELGAIVGPKSAGLGGQCWVRRGSRRKLMLLGNAPL